MNKYGIPWRTWSSGGRIAATVLFCVGILVAILASADHAKDAIDGIGVMAQSALAYFVYRLSHQQLEFSKEASNRQLRVDLLPQRASLYHQYDSQVKSLDQYGPKDYTSFANAFYELRDDAQSIFSDDVVEGLRRLGDVAMNIWNSSSELDGLDEQRQANWRAIARYPELFPDSSEPIDFDARRVELETVVKTSESELKELRWQIRELLRNAIRV